MVIVPPGAGVEPPARRSSVYLWRAGAAGCGLWLALSGATLADTLSSQSSVGVSSEYASNPFSVPSGAHAAEALALVANLPLTYTSDTQTLDLVPQFRYAQTHGDVALLSDYEYLNGDWHWNSDLNSFTATALWHHDSTLYNPFENAALLGHTLYRQEETASPSWKRTLSELSDVQLSGSWDQVAYSQRGVSSLTNYSYSQGSAQYDRTLSERWQSTSSAGYGRYELLDGSYSSDERFVQTAVSRALSERWSMTGQVGYSYLSARAQGYTCCQILEGPSGPYLQYIPVEETSSRGAPNYALTLERKEERLVLDLAASRAIQPSGLGALLTQDDVRLSASMPWTERLTLAAVLHWSRLSDALGRLELDDRHYYDFDLSANWQWTEHWTVHVQTSYIQQYLSAQTPQSSGVTVYMTLSRQFGRLRL